MKIGTHILFVFLAILATTACAKNQGSSEEALAICELSISKRFEVSIRESISDEELDYREHGEFKFGTINRKQIFVQYADDDPTKLEDIPFKDIDNLSTKLHSEVLAVGRSDLYTRGEAQLKIYCLVIPFSGLGSSGSFQKFSALIAVSVRDGKASKPVGAIVKRLTEEAYRARQAPNGR